MWDGMGWVGYLLGPTFRAPYGANNTMTASTTTTTMENIIVIMSNSVFPSAEPSPMDLLASPM